MSDDNGTVNLHVENGVGTVSFFHPKKNSLPGDILRSIASTITAAGAHADVRVVVLRSEGSGPFCAGASFDELLAVTDVEQGHRFFMGFAQVILAIRECPKFVIARVQGKAVGGGVGLVAASDYALAVQGASIRLSEFALGFGPFVIGPAVQRRIGQTAFSTASIDADWRDAAWAAHHGLYTRVVDDAAALDTAVNELAAQLAASNPQAVAELKQIFQQGTDDWPRLLSERAGISAKLVLTDFVQATITAIKAK
ncbi:MAG: enoyl-CoA hydratase/isomerase family protein [Planctomycetota bacterium]